MCCVVDLEIKKEVRKRRNNIHTALFLNPKNIIVGGVSTVYFEFLWSVLNYTVLYKGKVLLGYTSPTAQLPQNRETDNVEYWESKAGVHSPGFQAQKVPWAQRIPETFRSEGRGGRKFLCQSPERTEPASSLAEKDMQWCGISAPELGIKTDTPPRKEIWRQWGMMQLKG